MKSDQLRIRITGKQDIIPVDSFLVVVNNMLTILKDVDVSISGRNNPTLQWAISHVSMNSPMVVRMHPDSTVEVDFGKDVLIGAISGIDAVIQRSDAIPPHFKKRTVICAQRVAETLSDGIADVKLLTPYYKPLSFAPIIVKHAEEIRAIVEHSYHDFGTFEGKLTSVSIGGRNVLRVEDVIYGNITCLFDDDMIEKIKNGLLTERVSVYGETRYSDSGQPLSVRVERLERLRSRRELPQFSDMEKIGVMVEGRDILDYAGSLNNGH